jgi:predicted permease
MTFFAHLRSLAAVFLQRSRTQNEMDEELRSHIAHRADDLERSGLARAEAERHARVDFGSYVRLKEEAREAVGGSFLEVLFQDIRFGLRMAWRKPGFTVVAILTLAFAIGANAVVFAVLNAMVLHPLDLPQSQNLYMVEYGTHHYSQSYPDYKDMRDQSRAFDGVMAFSIGTAGLDRGQGSSQAWVYESSGNYFDVIGIQPYLGRFFHPSDEHGPDSAPYVVLSYGYWQSHFQGDRSIIGRTVQLNKYPFTVLGVAPPKFRGTAIFFSPDIWVPLVNQAQIEGQSQLTARGERGMWVVGRLKSGLTKAQLQSDLDSLAQSLAKAHPKEDDGISFYIARPALMGDFVGAAMRAFVGGLMAHATLILLAACANLGSLFAARAADRSKEVALRLALGSSRKRIMRQLLTEATMISLAGGAVGLGLCLVLLPMLSAWKPVPDIPINVPITPDASVYTVALLLALLSGLLFGMVPVRQILSSNPYQVIKSGAAETGRRFTLRDLLLTAQIAICAVLVTASLVAVRGLIRSLHSDFGFKADNTILVSTDLNMARYTPAQQPIMQRRLQKAIESVPGVTAAAYSDSVPLNMDTNFSEVFTDSTTDLKDSKAAAQTVPYNVSPGYFHASGTTLLAGREFTDHDDSSSPRVAVVNKEFARQIFGSVEKAIGGHFKLRDGTRIEVIGIAEDGKYISLTEDPQPVSFLPILQVPSSTTWIIVRSDRARSTADPEQFTAALRRALRSVDAGLPFTIKTRMRTLDTSFFPARIATLALGVLGALGAMLSVTGIFGMAAYSVSKRLREFGIRIALGAQRKEVLNAALGRTFRLLAFGSLAGLLLGLAAGKVLAYIVLQATPWDPLVLAGVLLTMLLLGLLAGWIPAQRALSTNPLILLREE